MPRGLSLSLWLLLTAGALLLFSVDFFEPPTSSGDPMPVGDVASGLVDGLAASPWHYQVDYQTGTMVFGILLCPVYAGCGSSLLWIKILSAMFLAGGIVFWALALGRVGGPKLQWLFVLWAVLPPPPFGRAYHEALAIHTESLFFLGLLLHLFARMQNVGASFREASLVGLVAGFAVFFSPENLPFAAAAAVVAVARWRGPGFRRLLWPGAFAFLIGVSPVCLTMDYRHTFGVDGIGIAGKLAVCAAHWWNLFFRILPHCADYRSKLLTFAWPLLIAAGAAAVVRETAANRKNLTTIEWTKLLLVLHVLFFFGAIGLSRDEVVPGFFGTRYLTSLSFSFFSLASIFLLGLRRYLTWPLVAPFLISTFVNVASNPRCNPRTLVEGWREYRDLRGDDYMRLVVSELPTRCRTLAEALAEIPKFPCRWRPEGYLGYGLRLPPQDFPVFARDAALPEYARRNVAIGLGIQLSHGLSGPILNRQQPSKTEISPLPQLEDDLARAAASGCGRGILDDKIGSLLTTFLFGDPDVKAQLHRETAARATELSASFPQLTPREFSLALARGFAEWLGYAAGFESLDHGGRLDDDLVRRTLALAEAISEDKDDPEARETRRDGIAAGLATWIKNNRNRIAFDPQSVFFPLLRDALAAQGLLCRPVPGRADECDLVVAPCPAPGTD
jgi:hypothetical protein